MSKYGPQHNSKIVMGKVNKNTANKKNSSQSRNYITQVLKAARESKLSDSRPRVIP
jgi:hypothetical protein